MTGCGTPSSHQHGLDAGTWPVYTTQHYERQPGLTSRYKAARGLGRSFITCCGHVHAESAFMCHAGVGKHWCLYQHATLLSVPLCRTHNSQAAFVACGHTQQLFEKPSWHAATGADAAPCLPCSCRLTGIFTALATAAHPITQAWLPILQQAIPPCQHKQHAHTVSDTWIQQHHCKVYSTSWVEAV